MNRSTANLRALTWNIHGGIGSDGRRDLERVGGWIRWLQPDIAALQEVDSRYDTREHDAVHDYLRNQVGSHSHMAWSISGADGHYGQILASRFPLQEKHVHDISVAGREPRRVIEARVDLPTSPLRVLATHLGLRRRERRRQVQRLREIILSDLSLPILLLGDFNEWSRWRAARSGLDEAFDVVTNHASFPSRFPLFSLDRVYCRPGLLLSGSTAVKEAHMASDHLPVLADLSLPVAVDLTGSA